MEKMKVFFLVSAFLTVLLGSCSDKSSDFTTTIIKLKDSSYIHYVSIEVKDSIITAYPAGYYSSSDYYSSDGFNYSLPNDYFYGDCMFGNVLLNVEKQEWVEFLNDIVYQDTSFMYETWKNYVLDFEPFSEHWISYNNRFIEDPSFLREVILNNEIDDYFERIE